MKKFGSMIEVENPKEFMKDMRYFHKHPVSLSFDITLDDPEAQKKTFKGVKSFGGWKKASFGKNWKKFKSVFHEDISKKKKQKAEKGFWK